MKTTKSSQPNPLAEGQMVIIIARWVLVVAGLVLILLDTASLTLTLIKFEIMVILALAVSNFYLVAQVLTKRKTLEVIVYGLGLIDIVVVTAIIIAQGGFESNVYTFYFPAILAFSVAFPTAMLCLFLGGTVGVYGFVCLLDADVAFGDLQTLAIRLLMLAAVGVVGNYFARLERDHRRAALQPAAATARPAGESAAGSPVQQTL